MEADFFTIIKVAGYAIEAFGVLVVILGSVIASGLFVRHHFTLQNDNAFQQLRQNLGRSIILGLEFLIAGDIIRTVIVAETLENVGILALIVVIRTFLSLTLHLEVEGRWPWQKPS